MIYWKSRRVGTCNATGNHTSVGLKAFPLLQVEAHDQLPDLLHCAGDQRALGRSYLSRMMNQVAWGSLLEEM